jgi:hypothetical protein
VTSVVVNDGSSLSRLLREHGKFRGHKTPARRGR